MCVVHQSPATHTHIDDEKKEVVGEILRIAVVTGHVTCWKTNQTDLHTTVGLCMYVCVYVCMYVCVCVCVCVCIYVANQSGMTILGNPIDDIRI